MNVAHLIVITHLSNQAKSGVCAVALKIDQFHICLNDEMVECLREKFFIQSKMKITAVLS